MFKDLSNQKFNKLTVVKFSERRGGSYFWECLCECGNKSIVDGYRLKTERIKSCGCLMKNKDKTKNTSYKCWYTMINRCTDSQNLGYADYGGRGIGVCSRWLVFENFIEDMGDRPSKIYSIERNNTNGNYEPGNCRWATTKEQTRNKRNNIWLEHNGERLVLMDWASKLGVNQSSLSNQLKTTPFNLIVEKYELKKSLGGNIRASSKIILDTQTGIFYDSIQSAAIAKNIPYSSLNHKLNNYKHRINNTGLIYA